MYSNVDCYELKLACYKYKLFPENLKVMTKQKTRIYTQSKNTTTKKIIKPERKVVREEIEELQKSQKTTKWQSLCIY